MFQKARGKQSSKEDIFVLSGHKDVAMRFAKRNAYLCSHAKLYDFINFASFLMLLIGTYIWNSGYRQLCYTRFRYASV